MSAALQPPYAADRARWRPHKRTRKVIMLVHILASVALVGEVWGLVALNLYATLTADAGLARAAYRLMEVLVFAGGIPLSFTALISGILLGLGSRWGVVRHFWVFTKLLLLIATILVGILLFNPEDLAAARQVTDAQQWGQLVAVSTQLLMLITATTLSVFKPRGRIGIWRRMRRGSPSPASANVRQRAGGHGHGGHARSIGAV